MQGIWSQSFNFPKLTFIGIAPMGLELVLALLVQPFRVADSTIIEKSGAKKTIVWFHFNLL